jgi:MoaA/NifB/PqqE/SkfB family radical SAM enzyme
MIQLPTLEFHAADNCQNRCEACNHGAPFLAPSYYTPKELERDLARVKPYLHAAKLWALGGEPLLNPEIDDVLLVMAASGVADRIGILTNGRLLGEMTDTFWQRVKEVTVSVYPNLPAHSLDQPAAKAREHGVMFVTNVFTSFYRTLRRRPLEYGETLALWGRCPFKSQCRMLDHGKMRLCPQSFAIGKVRAAEPGWGSFTLYPEHQEFSEEYLARNLNREEPLPTCAWCNFDHEQPWGQADNYQDWLERSYVDGNAHS